MNVKLADIENEVLETTNDIDVYLALPGIPLENYRKDIDDKLSIMLDRIRQIFAGEN